MKNYFCAYINYTQDDWVDNLPMAEFAASNYVNTSTGVTPFFADYGFHPQTSIKLSGMYKSKQKIKFLAADKIIKRQTEIITFLQN